MWRWAMPIGGTSPSRGRPTAAETLAGASLSGNERLALWQTVAGSRAVACWATTGRLALEQTVAGSLALTSLSSSERLALRQTVAGTLAMGSLSRNERLALRQTVAGSQAVASRATSERLAPGQTVAGSLASTPLLSSERLALRQTVAGSLVWSYGKARGSLADGKEGDCRPGAHPTGAWSRDGLGAKFWRNAVVNPGDRPCHRWCNRPYGPRTSPATSSLTIRGRGWSQEPGMRTPAGCEQGNRG